MSVLWLLVVITLVVSVVALVGAPLLGWTLSILQDLGATDANARWIAAFVLFNLLALAAAWGLLRFFRRSVVRWGTAFVLIVLAICTAEQASGSGPHLIAAITFATGMAAGGSGAILMAMVGSLNVTSRALNYLGRHPFAARLLTGVTGIVSLVGPVSAAFLLETAPGPAAPPAFSDAVTGTVVAPPNVIDAACAEYLLELQPATAASLSGRYSRVSLEEAKELTLDAIMVTCLEGLDTQDQWSKEFWRVARSRVRDRNDLVGRREATCVPREALSGFSPQPERNPEQIKMTQEKLDRVEKALGRLAYNEVQAIKSLAAGKTRAELGSELGMSPSRAGNLVTTSRKKLVTEYARLCRIDGVPVTSDDTGRP